MLTLADTGDPLVDVFRQHLQPEHLRSSQSGASSSPSSSSSSFHFFEFDHDGVGYLASTTVFPIDGEQSWVVGAIAPQSDFLAAVWRTRWMSLLAAAGALCIAGILAAAMARRISRPVHSLIGFMQARRRRGPGARADFRDGGRESDSCRSFNQMIADLRERLHLQLAPGRDGSAEEPPPGQ